MARGFKGFKKKFNSGGGGGGLKSNIVSVPILGRPYRYGKGMDR